MKSRKGFTLIELLVVIAIIACIAAITIPALVRARISALLNQSAAGKYITLSELQKFDGMLIVNYTDDGTAVAVAKTKGTAADDCHYLRLWPEFYASCRQWGVINCHQLAYLFPGRDALIALGNGDAPAPAAEPEPAPEPEKARPEPKTRSLKFFSEK